VSETDSSAIRLLRERAQGLVVDAEALAETSPLALVTKAEKVQRVALDAARLIHGLAAELETLELRVDALETTAAALRRAGEGA